MASLTTGNSWRGPVWNSNGSSSTSRYWLKLKAWPPGRSIGVLMRKMPPAISWTLVPVCGLVIIEVPRESGMG